MATNGILSIIHNGNTKFKIIIGSEGMCIPKLKQWFEQNKSSTAQDLYNKAKELSSCPYLVVQSSPSEAIFDKNEIKNLPKEYNDTFQYPMVNPRDPGEKWSTDFIERSYIYDHELQ
jgi:hypothetical protein